jgi:signal transduction histidine kinase
MTVWRQGVASTLAAITFVVAFAFTYGPDAIRMDLGPALLVSLVSAGAVWLSGVKPSAGFVVALVATGVLIATRSTFDAMPLVLVFVGFQALMRTSRSPWLLGGSLLVAMTANDLWSRHLLGRPFAETSITFPALMTALVVGLGLQSRRVRVQHAELASLREVERARAVVDERRRIARDVHDIAAHHLSALVVRNKIARRLDTHQALQEAADFSADTAATALDSLRQVVRVLSTEPTAPMAPQPSLSDIDDVMQRMASAGLEITKDIDTTVPVRRETEVAIVRILQEALANVLRHRGPGEAWVKLGTQSGRVELAIEDDGPTTWSGDTSDLSRHHGGGHGLIGMRERSEACGGSFSLSRSPRGGWLVAVSLPASVA